MLFNSMQFLMASCSGAAGADGQRSMLPTLLMMGGLFAVMYFLMIRPQKKKQQQEQEMRESIQIGDEITTIGGILGRVITVKEDSLVIETGADRSKMRIARWAIQTNNSAEERAQAEKEAAKAIQQASRTEREGEPEEGRKEKKRRRSKKSEEDA